MENLENQTVQEEETLVINSEINGYLQETAKWSKFLAIVGYVGLAILVIVSLAVMIVVPLLAKHSPVQIGKFPMGLFGTVYIAIAVLYYFPITYLYKFSVKMKQGLNSLEMPTVTAGFKNLKSLFKFMGIFTIVVLSLYAFILVFVFPLAMWFGIGK